MKKLVFMFVACATMSLAVSFSSCGNGAGTDSANVKKDTSFVDTLVSDTDTVFVTVEKGDTVSLDTVKVNTVAENTEAENTEAEKAETEKAETEK